MAPASATVGFERKPDTIIEPELDSNADLDGPNERRTSGSAGPPAGTQTVAVSQGESISALAEVVLQAGDKLSMPRDVLRATIGLIKPDSPEARSEEDEQAIAQAVNYEYEIWRETIVAKTQQSRKKSAPGLANSAIPLLHNLIKATQQLKRRTTTSSLSSSTRPKRRNSAK